MKVYTEEVSFGKERIEAVLKENITTWGWRKQEITCHFLEKRLKPYYRFGLVLEKRKLLGEKITAQDFIAVDGLSGKAVAVPGGRKWSIQETEIQSDLIISPLIIPEQALEKARDLETKIRIRRKALTKLDNRGVLYYKPIMVLDVLCGKRAYQVVFDCAGGNFVME